MDEESVVCIEKSLDFGFFLILEDDAVEQSPNFILFVPILIDLFISDHFLRFVPNVVHIYQKIYAFIDVPGYVLVQMPIFDCIFGQIRLFL